MTTLHNPVFTEALSEATETQLAPLDLAPTDYLEIWTHENGDDLIAKAFNGRDPSQSRLRQNSFLPASETRRPTKTTETGIEVLPTPHQPSETARLFFTRLVERRDLGQKSASRGGEWQIPPTDFNCLMIQSAWPRERIIFRSEMARTMFDVAVARFAAQNGRAAMQARFKLNGEVPDLPSQFNDREGRELADYQRTALAFCLKSEGTALFMDQGTGKTAVSVARICTEARMHRAGLIGDGKKRMMNVLVVCPKQVRLNWLAEIEKFATVAGKVTILRGGKARRMKLVTHAIRQEDDCAFSVVICNYETVTNDIDILEMIPWDLALLDESHYIKRSSTKRGRACIQKLREVSSRRMALTGTPIANTLVDFYGQAEFLGQGFSGFKTLSGFKSFHARFDARGQKIVGYENIPLFQERLARLSFRITKEEAGLKLPDKVYDLAEVEMTKEQTELYAQVSASISVEVEAGLQSGTMTVEHVLTRLLRLAQITAGHYVIDPVYSESGTEIRPKKVHQIKGGNPKLDAVVEMLKSEDDPNCKTIIFACWVPDIEAIAARLDEEGIRHCLYYGATSEADREQAIRDFNNDPELKVMVGNPTTMAEGLNLLGYNPDVPEEEQLPTYCGHEIFFSTDWSSVKRAQAEDRAHRRGTKMPVRITDLIVPETIDDVIRQRVTSKRESANRLQDIKGILSDVLNLDLNLDNL